MKFTLPILLFSLFASVGSSQITFENHFINDSIHTTDGIWSAFLADLDGDGDLDAIAGLYSDFRVVWYPNVDGQGNFGEQQIVADIGIYGQQVFGGDVDGDGDNDVLWTSSGKLFWSENLDGQGNFGTPVLIYENINGIRDMNVSDLNNDGHLDIIVGWNIDNIVQWFDNADGTGAFASPQTITSNVNIPTSVFAADLDGDQDNDVLSTSWTDNRIAWYKNTNGQGSFGAQMNLATNATGAYDVHAADLDGDGDKDVIGAYAAVDKIVWYKNQNGLGSFGTAQTIATGLDYPAWVFAVDLDLDGDLDVVCSSGLDDRLTWCENTNGLGSFGPPQLIAHYHPSGAPTGVHAGDIDGDGDTDFLAAYSSEELAWYETIQLVDLEAPVAQCNDVILHVNIDGTAALDLAAFDDGSTDDVGIVSYQLSLDSFTCNDIGDSISVQLVVLDASNNADTCSGMVIVVDTIAPVPDLISLPDIHAACEVTELMAPTATDNCDNLIQGTHDVALPITSQGATTVHWIFEDTYGNQHSQTQQIILADTINPTVFVQDITIDLMGAPFVSISPTQIDNGSFDNCGISELMLDVFTFDTTGIFPVVLTATDLHNNTAFDTAYVTVINTVVGVGELSQINVKVFPNPAYDKLYIKAQTEKIRAVQFYTACGKLQKTVFAATNAIDLTDMPTGVYIVKISTDKNGLAVRKIVKMTTGR